MPHSLGPGVTLVVLAALCGAACARPVPRVTAPQPHAVAAELLETDRAFGADTGAPDLIGALSAMFAADVVMPARDRFAEGRDAVLDEFRADPENARARATWAPVRAGISADGRHGFTFGHMSVQRPDGTTRAFRYLAYWTRRPEGWRVVAYRRRAAVASPPAHAVMPPVLPDRIVAATADEASSARHRASLAAAEHAFSEDAQRIGLGAAFTRHGSDEAINLGRPDERDFTFGAAGIGRAVGAGTPDDASPVSWSADRVLVASSGDLGITFGMIRANTPPPAGAPAAVPFFTIWRRAAPDEPWRYIAE